MNTASLTLRDLFGGEVKIAGVPPLGALANLADGVHLQSLLERALDVLDLNVVDLLIGGWRRHGEVRKQLQITAEDPSRTALVHVAEHTVESSHAPSLEVRAQGRLLVTLTLSVEVAFDVDAVALTIRGGEIREIRPGRITARGTVTLENSVILERELTSINLPGTLVIPSGAAPIPPDRPAAYAARPRADAAEAPIFA
jgi:hypothetical protein